MKRILLITLLFISIKGSSQSKLPQSAINDYSEQVYYHYNYGTDAFKVFFFRGMRNMGYHESYRIDMGIENIANDYKFREASFKAWYKFLAPNSNHLYLNLRSIEISPTNAHIIAEYIMKKYGSEDRRQRTEKEKQEKVDQLNREKQEKIKTEKVKLLRSEIYNLSDLNHEGYLRYKDSLINKITYIIKNHSSTEHQDFKSIYSYNFSNLPGEINLYTEELVLKNGNKINFLNSFKIKDPPIDFKDDIQVPITFNASDININFKNGITQIKFKKSKITFKDETLDSQTKDFIKSNFDGVENGIYEVDYVFGNVNEKNFDMLKQKFIKKSGSWILQTGLIAGGLLLLTR